MYATNWEALRPDKERRVGDMKIGEEGYIVRWAIDDDGYIAPNHAVSPRQGGAMDTLIRRTGEDTCIIVDMPRAFRSRW